MNRDLFLLALRCLGRIASELQPVVADVNAIRRTLSPQEAELPIDELCHLVIKREQEGPREIKEKAS